MKNRFLLSSFLTFFLGFFFLLFSNPVISGEPNSGFTGPKSPDFTSNNFDRLHQIQVNQVTGKINPQDILTAREQLEKLNCKGTSEVHLTWNSLGPNNYAARTRAILFDNRDASGVTIYAGAITGGIWQSTNLGLTWHQMNTASNNVLKVSAITQTTTGTIYAGTGESYCGSGQFVGTGLYRSEDGINFSLIPSTQPLANDPKADWAFITKLACDSRNNRLFAATNNGLLYSDNGDTWTMALPGYAVDVEVGSDGTVLAAVNDTAFIAVGGEVSNFVNLSTGLEGGLPTADNISSIEFAIAPSNASIMYASFAKLDGSFLNLYKSSDKGTTWEIVFPGNNTYFPFANNGCYANTLAVFPTDPNQVLFGGTDMWWGKMVQQAGFYSWVQVSFGVASALDAQYIPSNHHSYIFRPNDPNQVLIASDGGVTIGTVAQDLLTFQSLNKNYEVSQMTSVAMGPEVNHVLGGGRNVGTQVIGVYPVNDPGNGVQIWTEAGNPGNEGGNGGDCAWSMINSKVLIYSKTGTALNVRRSEDYGVTFSPTFFGSVASKTLSNAISQYIPFYLWESFNYQNSFDYTKYIATTKAIPADSTIIIFSQNAKFPIPYTTPTVIPKGDSVIIKDVVQSRYFIFATRNSSNGIYMTNDVLKFSIDPEWFQISKTGTDTITCITVSQDLNYLWAGTTRGKIYRISNVALAHDSLTADVSSSMCIVATESFDKNSYPFLLNRYVTGISISPSDDKEVLVTLGNYGNSNYVYLTNNALDSLPTFRPIQGNLPQMPVYSGLIEMHNHNRVLLGTDLGVFATDDITVSAPQWTESNIGLGAVPVTMIRQQTINYYPVHNYGAIYLSSFGRGLFMDSTFYSPMGIESPRTQASAGVLSIQPNPTENYTSVSYNLTKSETVNAYVYNLSGALLKTIPLGNQPSGGHAFGLYLNDLPNGTYIIRVNNSYGKVIKMN
jgi:hypothetical protein